MAPPSAEQQPGAVQAPVAGGQHERRAAAAVPGEVWFCPGGAARQQLPQRLRLVRQHRDVHGVAPLRGGRAGEVQRFKRAWRRGVDLGGKKKPGAKRRKLFLRGFKKCPKLCFQGIVFHKNQQKPMINAYVYEPEVLGKEYFFGSMGAYLDPPSAPGWDGKP